MQVSHHLRNFSNTYKILVCYIVNVQNVEKIFFSAYGANWE